MRSVRLDNGLTIIAQQKKGLLNTVLNILIRTGSASETIDKTGLAHFLEHMMFEGSINYPSFDVELQNMLGENNAFTMQDITNYYEVVPDIHLEKMLDIEYDRMTKLNFAEDKFKLQKKVIIEEFSETSINPPLSDLWHHLLAICYQGSYHWPVIGQKIDHISQLQLSDLKKFYTNQYIPENTTISVVSNRNESELITLIESKFSEWKSKEILPQNLTEKLYGQSIELFRKNISSPQLYIAFHIDDFGARAYFIADMLADLIANGEASILYQSLVINQQLCTEIQAYTTENISNNLLILDLKLNPDKKIVEVLAQVQVDIQNLYAMIHSDHLIRTAINKSHTYWTFKLYSNTELAFYISLFDHLGLGDPVESINSFFENIQLDEFLETSKAIFDISLSNQVIYLPK